VADLVAGDNTLLRVHCRDRKRQPVPLSGAAVDLVWRVGGGARQTSTMTITDLDEGVVDYRFQPEELPAGSFTGEVKIIDTNSHKVRCSKRIFLRVREAMS